MLAQKELIFGQGSSNFMNNNEDIVIKVEFPNEDIFDMDILNNEDIIEEEKKEAEFDMDIDIKEAWILFMLDKITCVAQILKTYTAAYQEIIKIAKKYIEPDSNLNKKVIVLELKELDEQEIIYILQLIKYKYENAYSLTIFDVLIAQIVHLSSQYLTSPAKAFQLLNTACFIANKNSVVLYLSSIHIKLALEKMIGNN